MSLSGDVVIEIGHDPAYSIATKPPARDSEILREAIGKASAFISEWTPFGLVASYFTFSVCLYMYCSEGLIAICKYIRVFMS